MGHTGYVMGPWSAHGAPNIRSELDVSAHMDRHCCNSSLLPPAAMYHRWPRSRTILDLPRGSVRHGATTDSLPAEVLEVGDDRRARQTRRFSGVKYSPTATVAIFRFLPVVRACLMHPCT